MRKWIFVFSFLIVCVLLIWTQFLSSSHQAPVVEPTLVSVSLENKVALPKLPASLGVSSQSIPLIQRMDPQALLTIGRKNYRLVEGKVALTSAQAKGLTVPIESQIGNWVIIDERDAPADKVSYPIVQREGSTLRGIFRGVIKAQSLAPLNPVDISHCPGSVLSSMPAIKIALIELSSPSSPEELKSCLIETRLFKRLEWEVLDQPRVNR